MVSTGKTWNMGTMASNKEEVSMTLNECCKHSFTETVSALLTSCFIQQKAQSVKDALEILVGRDQLEGVTCSCTNQEIEAWQQVTLKELPLVLLLRLKCFDYKLDGASKIVKCVEFPIDLKVDPSKYSSLTDDEDNLSVYCLMFCIINAATPNVIEHDTVRDFPFQHRRI
jgi:hypothetical protein